MADNHTFIPASERRELRNTGLAAALVGSGSTGVLLWNAAAFPNGNYMTGTAIAGSLPLAAMFTVTQTAVLGTEIKILRRGKYELHFIARVPASGGAAFGISYQAPAASFLSGVTPDLAVASNLGFVTATGLVTIPAATSGIVPLTVSISVSDPDVGAAEVAGGGSGSVVRFHGTGGGAAGIIEAADIDEAATSYKITYLGDHQAA